MSDPSVPSRTPARIVSRLRRSISRAGTVAFGDRGGLAVFLAAALSLGVLWRVGIFIEDSNTIANAVANVAAGRLEIVDVPYSLTATGQPGLVEADGRLYARNYGHVYVATLCYLLLAAVTTVVPLGLVLLGAWCLGLVALCRSSAHLLERPLLEVLGSLLAVGVLVASLPVLPAISPSEGPLVALQLSTLLVTAWAGTLSYRILRYFHGRRSGFLAGGLVVLATPLGFWGSIPKRHALAATLALAAVAAFALSRRSGRPTTRAAGYAAIGFLSAIHAFEAAFLLAVFAPIELLTAPENSGRTLALVGVVLVASSAPMFATNAAISGDPLTAPRMLSGASDGGFPADLGSVESPVAGDAVPGPPPDTGVVAAGGSIDASSGSLAGQRAALGGPDALGGGGASGDGADRPGVLPLWLAGVFGLASRLWDIGAIMVEAVAAGLGAAGEPDRLFYVFVRSGWNPFVSYGVTDFEAIDLALLEVLPLAGALVYVPVAAMRRLRDGVRPAAASLRAGLTEPVRQTDLLVGSLGVTFVLVYLPRLPLHSQITLRYVVPAMALVAYGVVRLGPVRRAIDGAPRVLAIGYLLSVVAVVAGLSATVATVDLAVGEAMQLQALVGVAAASLAGLAVCGWPLHRDERAVALGVAVSAGVGTAFLVLSSLVYFEYGNHALALARFLADLLPAVG